MKQVVIPWTNGTGNITLTFTGQGNDTVIVASDDNSLDVARSQAITVKTADGSVHRTVIVTQEAGSHSQPYDAEIEYLESSGTQYINTMVAPTLDTEIQCVVIPINVGVNVLTTDLQNTFGIHITNWSMGSWACYFGNKGYIPSQSISKFKYNIPQSVILNYQKVTIDGVEYGINATSMSGTTMYMFGDTWGTSLDNTRICSLKIKQNNIIVRDFIPVRISSTGYMYDKVSGQLFGNVGTGDFILGPDIQ